MTTLYPRDMNEGFAEYTIGIPISSMDTIDTTWETCCHNPARQNEELAVRLK